MDPVACITCGQPFTAAERIRIPVCDPCDVAMMQVEQLREAAGAYYAGDPRKLANLTVKALRNIVLAGRRVPRQT
jgi:hypothetical protein